MSASRAHRRMRCVWTVLLFASGCAADPGYEELRHQLEREQPRLVAELAAADDVGFFGGARELDRALLIRRVLERNPTLRAAHSAFGAALERYPQARAFDDPMLGYQLAPRSLSSSEVDSGQRFDLKQSLPFPGKRRLRGDAALAEAAASRHDLEALRVELAALASTAFDDYYLALRALEINADHADLLRVLSRSALARYRAGAGSQQDPLQAELEIVKLAQDRIELSDELSRSRAQLNTLLHRPPDALVPDPPTRLSVSEERDGGSGTPPSVDPSELELRPDLAAARERVNAREAERSAAWREFFPDVVVMGSYNRFMQESELRPSVGLEFPLPLQLGRRRAQLRESEARLEQARSEARAQEDRAGFELLRARQELDKAHEILALFVQRLLPTAQDRTDAARVGYETGRNGFAELVDAAHELSDVRYGAERALAEVSRREALLRAAQGKLPPAAEEAR